MLSILIFIYLFSVVLMSLKLLHYIARMYIRPHFIYVLLVLKMWPELYTLVILGSIYPHIYISVFCSSVEPQNKMLFVCTLVLISYICCWSSKRGLKYIICTAYTRCYRSSDAHIFYNAVESQNTYMMPFRYFISSNFVCVVGPQHLV